jgi:hypothetical protein
VAGEGYIRLRYFGPSGLSYRHVPAFHGNPLARSEVDENSITSFHPGSDVFLWGQPYHVNSLGFLDREPTLKKSPGVFRILAFGASYTLGVGVKEEDRYTSLLERRLNSEPSHERRYEVLNLALQANTVGNCAFYIQELAPELDPDLILVELSRAAVNDPDSLEIRKTRLIRYPGWRLQSGFYLAQVLRDAYKAVVFGPADLPKIDPEFAQREMSILKRAAGKIPVVAVYLRTPSEDMNDRTFDRDAVEVEDHAAQAAGLSFIDTTAARYPDLPPRRLVVYAGNGHPNALVHAAYAEYMAQRLRVIIHPE